MCHLLFFWLLDEIENFFIVIFLSFVTCLYFFVYDFLLFFFPWFTILDDSNFVFIFSVLIDFSCCFYFSKEFFVNSLTREFYS